MSSMGLRRLSIVVSVMPIGGVVGFLAAPPLSMGEILSWLEYSSSMLLL
jgi:hypothetical protein